MKFLLKFNINHLKFSLIITLIIMVLNSCSESKVRKVTQIISFNKETEVEESGSEENSNVKLLLVLPKNPQPGKELRILASGIKNIRKAQIIIKGQTESFNSEKNENYKGFTNWRIDFFSGIPAGDYKVILISENEEVSSLDFNVSDVKKDSDVEKNLNVQNGWNSESELLYSLWINALFYDCDERSSWRALHEVTQNQKKNFLYNYLSLGEDEMNGKSKVIMEPDCADNPYYLRAYYAWKMGLPFGFHVCDRGGLGRSPKTGQWIVNSSSASNVKNVSSFNSFLRRVMDVVHSGSARTALKDETSDYYPVSLEKSSLRPGIVFADPYGHTFVLTGFIPQTNENPGSLLSVDAQPDGTVGVKRFWKGNFQFNTVDVIGEPGFKAFRPIKVQNGVPGLMKNEELNETSGFIPFSSQQKDLNRDEFYHIMDRIINPNPLDPESALTNLIQALHEQLLVRVNSVANGEEYMRTHPGAVIPMPSSATAVFQTLGIWEDFSTPNRDLRLLIAMDAVLDFPNQVIRYPEDYDIPKLSNPEKIKAKLQALLEKKTSELEIQYTRTDGAVQKLTVWEILNRKDAFEMAYNPNDGIEIRWGVPENSIERSTCKRRVPQNQFERMKQVRKWFQKRLHPPT